MTIKNLASLTAAFAVSMWAFADAQPNDAALIAVRSSETLAIFSDDGTMLGAAGELFWAPNWSPDGSQLAVLQISGSSSIPGILGETSGRALFSEARDANYLFKPIWSPDGRSIALLEHSSEQFSIVIVDVASAEIIAETPVPERFTAGYPYYTAGIDSFSWSPDGEKIVLSWQGVLVFDVLNDEVHVASDGFALAFWPPDSGGICLLHYEREGPNPIKLGYLSRYNFESRKLSSIATSDEIANAGITRADWLIAGSIQLSPDLRSVAVSMGNSATQSDAIRIYDASENCISDLEQPRLIVETALIPVMEWSPDGAAIVAFEEVNTEGPRFSFAARVINLETADRLDLLRIELEGVEVDRFGLVGMLSWSH